MEVPTCVDVCPTKALELIELDDYEEFLGAKRAETLSGLQQKTAPEGGLLLDLERTNG
jgi:ferredoxin